MKSACSRDFNESGSLLSLPLLICQSTIYSLQLEKYLKLLASIHVHEIKRELTACITEEKKA